MINDLMNYLNLGGYEFPYVGISANSYYLTPTDKDYKTGFIERFFVKRINDSRVIEINRDEYYSLTTDLYLKIQINWFISNSNKSNISRQNMSSVKSMEKFFSTNAGLPKDFLQFYKG